MTNIIQFPRRDAPAPTPDLAPPGGQPKPLDGAGGGRVLSNLIKVVWVVTVLLWPLMKWILSLDVLFQFARMIYHWNTPDVYPTWMFLFHLALLVVLTYFVSLYKPKGV
ncbi:MAG: KleE stable inheritance protein [Candidatus Accumulibacter necessarius]|jgi:hypothetical protein